MTEKNILTTIAVLGARIEELELELVTKNYKIERLERENQALTEDAAALTVKLTDYMARLERIASETKEG